MTDSSLPIYCRGADNKTIRYWHYEVDGDKWRGHYGVLGGKDAVSGWSTATPTNVGRANERNAEQQAAFEAAAEEAKKLAREYRRSEDQLDEVPAAVMLALDYAKVKKPFIFNPRAIACQPKLDGIRMVASARGDYTREFQPFGDPVIHIREALAPIFDKYPALILDGELYNHGYHDNFNAISSLIRKQKLTEEQRLKTARVLEYHIYDVPSVTGGFTQRHDVLAEIFAQFDLDLDPLVMVPTTFPETLEEIDQAYADALAEGYEGQIIRLNEPYGFGVRSPALIKRKTFVTEEFEVVRIIEGNGNWAGYAKAVEFRMPNGALTEQGELPKAGIRGSQEFCRELLLRDPPPKIVTVRHLGLTPGGVPRGPVAIDFDRKD